MKTIASIDASHNGYVTTTEADDIIKLLVPELDRRNLKSILTPFCSSANKVLMDYKRLRDFIVEGLKMTDEELEQRHEKKPSAFDLGSAAKRSSSPFPAAWEKPRAKAEDQLSYTKSEWKEFTANNQELI